MAATSLVLAIGPFKEMSVILYSPQEFDLLGLNPDVQEYCREAEASGTVEADSRCDPPLTRLLEPYTTVIDEILG